MEVTTASRLGFGFATIALLCVHDDPFFQKSTLRVLEELGECIKTEGSYKRQLVTMTCFDVHYDRIKAILCNEDGSVKEFDKIDHRAKYRVIETCNNVSKNCRSFG